MSNRKTIAAIFMMFLVGCGGEDTATNVIDEQGPTEPQEVAEVAEVELPESPRISVFSAAQDFTFRVDREFTLNFMPPNHETGSFNVYWKILAEDPNSDKFVVDPSSLITTVPDSTRRHTIMVNNSWKEIVVEWQPNNGMDIQQKQRVPIGGLSEYTIYFD